MKWLIGWMAPLLVLAVPAQAQVRTVDPNDAIDGDLAPQQTPAPVRTPDPVSAPRSAVRCN